MLLDWFTIAAEIVNFLVLVALLRHFLYGPLLRAIDAREQRIASQLAEAIDKDRQAAELKEKAEKEIADLDVQRARILSEARDEAGRGRKEMLAKAREEVDTIESKWHDELTRERKAFLDEVCRRTAEEVLAVSRHAVADLACAEIECTAIHAFLGKLRTFDPEQLRAIIAAGPTVASPWALPDQTRHEIQTAVESIAGHPIELKFEPAPTMAWGIELRGDGQRIGWTPDSYFDALEENLTAVLDHGASGACRVT